MRTKFPKAVALVLSLSACTTSGLGPTPQAVPQKAWLYRDNLNVLMSDGAFCAAPRPANANLWSGKLGGCVHELSFTVEYLDGSNPVRLVLEQVGLEPVLSPLARLEIIDGQGRKHQFASPPPLR